MWKEILRAGRWTLRNGKTFDCAPEDLDYFCQRLNDMTSAGLLVPACWEHQVRAVPMSAADWHELHTDVAKHTITHLTGADIRQGHLGVYLEPKDPSDLRQLAKTGYVSPYIDWDYIDPKGRLWEGPSILHVAVTPVPIQIEQTPFAAKGSDGAFLSSVGQSRKTPKKKREPVFLSGARLNPIALGSNMADEKDKKDEPQDEEIVVDEEPKEEPAPPVTPPAPTMPSEAEMRIKEALACAAYEGLMLGSDTTLDNFIDRFITACRTKRAVEDKLKAEADEDKLEDDVNEETPTPDEERDATPGPVLMSQAEQDTLKKRHDAFAQQLLTTHRTGLAAQIRGFKKQLGDETVSELLAKLDKAPLALSQTGTLQECKELIEINAELKVAQRLRDKQKVALSGKPQLSAPHDGTGNVDTGSAKKNGQELGRMFLGNRAK